MEIKEITEGPVRQLTLGILQGWEPAPPPTELEVHRFDWGHGLPLPAVARKLNINGSQLTVVCRATSIVEMHDAFSNDALRNRPVEGEAADGYLFSAQYAHVRCSTLVRHREWLDWCNEHAKEIRALVLPGKEDRLLNAVKMADMAGASAIVVEVCSRMGLTIDDIMKNALETRNDVAHDASLPFINNIDQFIVLVDAPRTLLIALIAKLVTYNGPILGYHSRADPRSPSWWVEGQIPADAEQNYQVTSGTRSADS